MEPNRRIIVIESTELLEEISRKLDLLISLVNDQAGAKRESMPEVLTNTDVMRILKVSSSTLQGYRSKGLINFTKRGKKVYYSRKDIEDYISSEED